jgi:hypothetical protein
MSLAFHNSQAGPQTHIFIIGIGEYPHLAGGRDAMEQGDTQLATMGQLTSPPVTALKLYEKFKEFHDRKMWITPLGSIRMLVSAPPAVHVPADLSSGPPTMENIRTHFRDWFEACDTHEDNVAIFYFCGHGLEKGDHFLLASDFNDYPADPWDKMFSFDQTRSGFHGCKASTQLFFDDSCRIMTDQMRDYRFSVPGLRTPSDRNGECLYDMTIKSAAKNRAAHGRKMNPSHFAAALISGMSGQCASRNENQEWVIETNLLGSAIKDIMRSNPATASTPVQCPCMLGNSKAILKLSAAPEIPLTVSCLPDTALAHAAFACSDGRGVVADRMVPENIPWRIALKPGAYTLAASFSNRDYTNSAIDTLVIPPFKNEKIKCQ